MLYHSAHSRCQVLSEYQVMIRKLGSDENREEWHYQAVYIPMKIEKIGPDGLNIGELSIPRSGECSTEHVAPLCK